MIELDGTDNKSKLGANGILAVSLAVARVGQAARCKAAAAAAVLRQSNSLLQPTCCPLFQPAQIQPA